MPAKLLNELAGDINAKCIQRNRITYPAPKAAWVWAINIMLERRDQGKLQLPLKNHGYLYEVISSFKPENAPTPNTQTQPARVAKTDDERAQELREHERQKFEKPAMSFAEMMKQTQEEKRQIEQSTLKDIPQNQLFAYVGQNRLEGETHKQCFDRLKAAEQSKEGKIV